MKRLYNKRDKKLSKDLRNARKNKHSLWQVVEEHNEKDDKKKGKAA